jgi:protein kinase C substrate 80K-H
MKSHLRVALLLVAILSFTWAVRNDDYCDDLKNGSDEGFSSACSGYVDSSVTTCKDNNWVVQKIFSSRIGDGVCDCCDGSDETAGLCTTNTCESIGQALKESKRAYAESRVRGIKRKEQIATVTIKKEREMQEALNKETVRGPVLDQAIRVLEAKIEEEKKREEEELQSKADEAQTVYKRGIEILAGGLDKESIIQWICALTIRSKEEATEAIGASLPNGGADADVSEALIVSLEGPEATDGDLTAKPNAPDELIMRIDGVKTVGPASFVLSKAKLSQSLLGDMREALNLKPSLELPVLTRVLEVAISEAQVKQVVLLSALDANIFPDLTFSQARTAVSAIPVSSKARLKLGYTGEEGTRLREELATAQQEREVLKNDASQGQMLRGMAEGTDYGPDSLYLHFLNQCFRRQHGSYQYSVCPFKEAKQGHTILGRYQGITYKPPAKRPGDSSNMMELSDALNAELGLGNSINSGAGAGMEMWMTFTGGQYCPPAKRSREMHVKLECSSIDSDELFDLLEPETCFYVATVKTPVAC